MKQSKKMALGGIFAALAIVIMSLGGLIPVATFVCPMLCMLLLRLVTQLCGKRIGWAWYGSVAILSLLLGPDKEASAVFVFLGYYPILKPKLDATKTPVLWKFVLFNIAVGLMYFLLIRFLGLEKIAVGTVLTVILLILGNVTFILLDIALERLDLTKKRRGR